MRRWLMLAVLTITQVAPDPAQAYVFGSASINETLNLNIVDVCAAVIGEEDPVHRLATSRPM